jgi:uncharacterized protein DUF4136
MNGKPLVIIALVAAVGCAGIEVTHDFDPDFEFSGFQTYDWMPQASGRRGRSGTESAVVQSRLRTAVESILEEQGFRKSPGGEPDFRVGYVLAIDEEVSYAIVNNYYGPAWGVQRRYSRRPPRSGPSRTVERKYEVGTVILDIFDVESRELVWRGTGEARLSGADPSNEELQERATESVRKILEMFPPGG